MLGVLYRPFVGFWESACALGRRLGVSQAAPSQPVGVLRNRLNVDRNFKVLESDDGPLATAPSTGGADASPPKEPASDTGAAKMITFPKTSLMNVEEEEEYESSDSKLDVSTVTDPSQMPLVGTQYKVEERPSLGGRILDLIVNIAGTRESFGVILLILVGWAIAGAVLGAPDDWQIILQDVSSIQCYISDTVLMRQQQNDFRERLRIIAILRSRADTVAVCFSELLKQGRLGRVAKDLERFESTKGELALVSEGEEAAEQGSATGLSNAVSGLELTTRRGSAGVHLPSRLNSEGVRLPSRLNSEGVRLPSRLNSEGVRLPSPPALPGGVPVSPFGEAKGRFPSFVVSAPRPEPFARSQSYTTALARLSSVRSVRGRARSFLGLEKERPHLFENLETAAHELDAVGDGNSLPQPDTIDKVIEFVADCMGSIWMVIIFWVSMIAWLALGPKYDWSNNWQLWLNTCTALQQTLSTTLLTMARHRHGEWVDACMQNIYLRDCELEYRARALTGEEKDNPTVEIEWKPQGRAVRAIDWYAALLGSGPGVAISAVLFAGWIGLGDPMGWSGNWWLIIGTYTGVLGTINAAILRFSLTAEDKVAQREFQMIVDRDQETFALLGLKGTEGTNYFVPTLMARLSIFISKVCASLWTVLLTIVFVVALLVLATAMLWSETGQLIVNSATMILESFFLIVLIEAHNISATDQRVKLHDLLIRRLQLIVVLRRVDETEAQEAAAAHASRRPSRVRPGVVAEGPSIGGPMKPADSFPPVEE